MRENQRIKSLFLPAWYPSVENPAAGVFIKEHAKAVSLYSDVTVLYSEKKSVRGLYKIVSDEKEDGIRTIRTKHKRSPIPKTSDFIHLWSIFAAFKKLSKEGWRPDIIHAHVYSAGVPAVIIGKIYNIPVVITEHWTGFIRHTLKNINKFKALFAMNRANIILPVSKGLEEAIKSYGIKNQFKTIPNVVNTEIFSPPSSLDNKSKKNLLLVGLITPQKGISFLLRALAKLKQKRQDFILHIVGDGENRGEYEDLTRDLALGEAVKFHGIKTKEETAGFMRNCTFFVQPSLFETFGVTYIEAMACGKPIVATQLPVIQEKVNEERGILVPPRDIKTLAKAIDYMLDHYQDYPIENIRQYAEDRFSYAVVGKEINNIYREILKESDRDRNSNNKL